MISQRWLAPVVIGLVILAALGGALGNDFVNDDTAAIVGNSRAHDPTDLPTIFSTSYWTNALYRPVTVTTFAALWAAGNGTPLPYFVTNLGLHFFICLLLLTALRQLGTTAESSLVAVLLFAVHPVHVEVVANGVGLAELLSTSTLMIGAVLTLRRPWLPGTALLLGICGLLAFFSKESAITALALIPLFWYARMPEPIDLPSGAPRTALLTLLLFLMIGLAVRTLVLDGLHGEAPIRALAQLDTVDRARTVLGVIPEWARLLLWPATLQADYGPPQLPIGGPFTSRHTLGTLVLLGWGAGLGLAIRRGNRLVAAGLLWVPIALSPVSNLLFPTGILLAERTLFLPSVGMALVAAGLIDGMKRWRRPAIVATMGLIVLGGMRSHSRVGVWHDQETFNAQLVVDGARSYRSWYIAGLYTRNLGQVEETRQHFAESWRLEKRDYRVAEEYGQLLRAKGDFEGAIVVMEEAFRMAPNEEPLTSRLLESLMALSRWEEAEALVHEVASLSAEDGDRLRRRLRAARVAADSAHSGRITGGGARPSTLKPAQ